MAGIDAPQLRPSGNYRGEVNGNAQVEWIRVGSRYQVNLDLLVGPEFAPIITRRMSSEGDIAASGLVPTRYDEDTRFMMRDPRRMSVVFEADAVVLANGQRRERWPGVQDTASQFIQLTYLFTTHPELLRVGGTVAFPLALPRAMDSYVYEVVEAPDPADAVPPLASFHLKPRPRPTRRPNQLTAELWIAPELRFLPVRIRIDQDAPTFIDLMIARQARDGRPVGRYARRTEGEAAMTTYECILTEVRGRVAPHRPDHAEPAQAAQRAQRRADGRARRRAERVRRRRRDRLHRRHRRRQGVRRRRRHPGDGALRLRRCIHRA